MTVSEHFKSLVDELQRRAECGDEFSLKSLAALALLAEGWRYGDPDPDDGGPDDGGCEVVELADVLLRRAA